MQSSPQFCQESILANIQTRTACLIKRKSIKGNNVNVHRNRHDILNSLLYKIILVFGVFGILKKYMAIKLTINPVFLVLFNDFVNARWQHSQPA